MTTAWSQSKEELISGNGCFFIGYGKKRKEYVAITRARYYLYILNTKCKAILGE